jgi:hypothetical protein
MKTRWAIAGASLAALTFALGPAAGMPSLNARTIVIENSGSTNTIGFRVWISPEGHAAYVSGAGTGEAPLPHALFHQLRHDVERVSPLANLPVPPCMKSFSFGTKTYLAVDADHSPDLSCPASGTAQALEDDVAAVIGVLKIGNVARSQGTLLPPEKE